MAQVIKLTGVVDDGSCQNPEVPINTAREIQFPRLADVRIELTIVNNAGVRVTGASNLQMTFQARLTPGAPGPTLTKAGVIIAPGQGLVTIASADTQMFQSMRLFYDAWVTLGASAVPPAPQKYQIIRTGIARLEPNITFTP